MSWDDLSMREKSAMMRVAVKNKIFDIDNIKKQYNSYAEGGLTQKKYPTYNELINNPEYGLVLDTFNGKLIYRLPGDPEKAKWFYASRAEETPNQTVDWPIIAPQKQADNYDAKWYNYNQPATMNYISSQIDNIANKVDSNKGFSFHAENPTLDTALSFAPFYGTLMDVEDAIKDPSLYNIGNAALGVITDLTGISLTRSLAKSIKAASKAKKAASKYEDVKKAYDKAVYNQSKYGNNKRREKITRNTFRDMKDAEQEFLQTHKKTNRRKAVDRTRKIRYETPENLEDIVPMYTTLEGTNVILNTINQADK